MSSLQFIGIEKIVNAFEYRKIPVWAIFDGRRLMHKGKGVEDLTEFLEMIAESGTTAPYILKVYEDVDDPKAVKNNTPDDGSFNFKLAQSEGGAIGSGRRGYSDAMGHILDRLDAIDDRLNGTDEGDETGGEPGFGEQLQSAIIGMVQDPNKLQTFLNIFKGPGVASGIPFNGPYRPASVGNASPTQGSQGPSLGGAPLTEADLMRIGDAVETLAKYDPKAVDHLERLAKMAETSPQKFRSILAMFDTML